MAKADLVEAVYERMGLSHHECSAAVEATLQVLKEVLDTESP